MKILVIDSKIIRKHRFTTNGILCECSGGLVALTSDNENMSTLREILSNSYGFDRAPAEEDPSMLQIIPYVVLRNRAGEVFSYWRTKKGNERKLHDKRSVGVGGHIDLSESDAASWKFMANNERLANYQTSLMRELVEEVDIDVDRVTDKGKAAAFQPSVFIFENTEVGRVHLGVLHVLDVETSMLGENLEDHLTNPKWCSLAELSAEHTYPTLESWSKSVVDFLISTTGLTTDR